MAQHLTRTQAIGLTPSTFCQVPPRMRLTILVPARVSLPAALVPPLRRALLRPIFPISRFSAPEKNLARADRLPDKKCGIPLHVPRLPASPTAAQRFSRDHDWNG